MTNNNDLWSKCIEFHGHECGGLAIGYKVSLLASELLEMSFSDDEELVCVAENDACSVDAVSVILGCSVGKGNLLFRLRGKQAFSFFNRKTGKSVRLVLKDISKTAGDNRKEFILNSKPHELFLINEPQFSLPELAKIFKSMPCESCGENTAENYLRLQEDKKVCLDCFKSYSRFI